MLSLVNLPQTHETIRKCDFNADGSKRNASESIGGDRHHHQYTVTIPQTPMRSPIVDEMLLATVEIIQSRWEEGRGGGHGGGNGSPFVATRALPPCDLVSTCDIMTPKAFMETMSGLLSASTALGNKNQSNGGVENLRDTPNDDDSGDEEDDEDEDDDCDLWIQNTIFYPTPSSLSLMDSRHVSGRIKNSGSLVDDASNPFSAANTLLIKKLLCLFHSQAYVNHIEKRSATLTARRHEKTTQEARKSSGGVDVVVKQQPRDDGAIDGRPPRKRLRVERERIDDDCTFFSSRKNDDESSNTNSEHSSSRTSDDNDESDDEIKDLKKDKEYGLADEKVEDETDEGRQENEDGPMMFRNRQNANGNNSPKHHSIHAEYNHSSCPPFPYMWESSVGHVMGTLTATARMMMSMAIGAAATMGSEKENDNEKKNATPQNTPSDSGLACGAHTPTPPSHQNRNPKPFPHSPIISLFPAGGRHHAKRDRAEGFCIFNDVVIAVLVILEFYKLKQQRAMMCYRQAEKKKKRAKMLKQQEDVLDIVASSFSNNTPPPPPTNHCRILIIDIDAHHGDGTEEAFQFDSKRVTTLSMHGYGKGFYPGTGGGSSGISDGGTADVRRCGGGGGANTFNIPLPLGATDETILPLFKAKLDAILAASLKHGDSAAAAASSSSTSKHSAPSLAAMDAPTPPPSVSSASSLSSSRYTHCILVAGTDAVKGDPHGGGLSLSIRGFRHLVEHVVREVGVEYGGGEGWGGGGIPLLIVGAGGYNDTTTAICWSHILTCCAAFVDGANKNAKKERKEKDDHHSSIEYLTEVPTSLSTFALYKATNFQME